MSHTIFLNRCRNSQISKEVFIRNTFNPGWSLIFIFLLLFTQQHLQLNFFLDKVDQTVIGRKTMIEKNLMQEMKDTELKSA